MKTPFRGRDDTVIVQLPPDSFLESTVQEDVTSLRQQCTYKLSTASHALRHAGSLLMTMTMCIRVPRPARDLLSSSLEYIPWLLDSYFALYRVQEQWLAECPSTLRSLLQSTVQLIAEFQERADINVLLKQKASSLLVQLSIEGAEHFDRLCSDEEDADTCKQLLCSAILTIVKFSTIEKPLSKLVSSQLLPCLEKLSIQHELIVPETDLWVCLKSHLYSGY
jgi:serine/threonine-protein kinase ATR